MPNIHQSPLTFAERIAAEAAFRGLPTMPSSYKPVAETSLRIQRLNVPSHRAEPCEFNCLDLIGSK